MKNTPRKPAPQAKHDHEHHELRLHGTRIELEFPYSLISHSSSSSSRTYLSKSKCHFFNPIPFPITLFSRKHIYIQTPFPAASLPRA
jgi:hypothetical protein